MPSTVDWAPERAVSMPLGFYHWERAVMLLQRYRVPLAQWPDPYERHPGTGEYRAVEGKRRRELLRQCAELRCQIHLAFAANQVDAVLARHKSPTRPPRPKKRLTEDDSFLHASDAVAFLMRRGIVPSDLPDIYEGSEPQPAHDQADAVRRLFTEAACADLYIREAECTRYASVADVVAMWRSPDPRQRVFAAVSSGNAAAALSVLQTGAHGRVLVPRAAPAPAPHEPLSANREGDPSAQPAPSTKESGAVFARSAASASACTAVVQKKPRKPRSTDWGSIAKDIEDQVDRDHDKFATRDDIWELIRKKAKGMRNPPEDAAKGKLVTKLCRRHGID